MKYLLASLVSIALSFNAMANDTVKVSQDIEVCSGYKTSIDFYNALLDSQSAKHNIDFLFQVLEWKLQAEQEYQSCLANQDSAEFKAGLYQQY